MYITSLYAAILAILFVGLSARTILVRRELRIAIGDASNDRMRRAMRVHANFAEYVPLALLLLFFLEATTGRTAVIHAIGIGLVVGRCLHAYGVSKEKEPFGYRVAGMVLTFAAILFAAIGLLINYVLRFAI
jgi:uncharacterized protein